MGLITLAVQYLQKRVAAFLEIIYRFDDSDSLLFYYIIITSPSNAKSREEQDNNKQNFVRGTMAKLWPFFHLDVAKNKEDQRFEPC